MTTTFTRRASRVALLAALMATGGVPLAAAQTTASNPEFARMRERLKTGDRLNIHLADGVSVEGQFAGTDLDGLSVRTTSGVRRLGAADISRVQRTRRGYLLGTIVGAGVGIACGAALASYARNEGGSQGAAFGLMTALGTGAGLGIDALINFPRTVYRRPSPHAALQIDARPRRAGIGVIFSF